MKNLFLSIGLCVSMSATAATFPTMFTTNSGGGNANQFSQGGGAVSIANAAKTTNFNIFGPTNYFANDLPGNTNGPLSLYRTAGSANLSNLFMNIDMGSGGTINSRFSITAVSPASALDFGGLVWLPDHDSPGTVNQFGGYALNNQWWYFTSMLNVLTGPATNFSAALAFNTSELQGGVISNHFPAILAFSIQTNTPGRYALLFAQDLDQQKAAPFDTWDPNTAKAAVGKWWMQMIGGDTNVILVNSNLSVGGTLTAPFDYTNHANVAFNPDPTRGRMNYFPTNITAGVVLINALTNMDTTGTRWFDFTCVLTNSHGSGGPFAVVLPANVHTNMAGTVQQLTNVTYVRFSGIGGVFTNGKVEPQY